MGARGHSCEFSGLFSLVSSEASGSRSPLSEIRDYAKPSTDVTEASSVSTCFQGCHAY